MTPPRPRQAHKVSFPLLNRAAPAADAVHASRRSGSGLAHRSERKRSPEGLECLQVSGWVDARLGWAGTECWHGPSSRSRRWSRAARACPARRADRDHRARRHRGNAARPRGRARRRRESGQAGIHSLPNPYDAFAARVLLAAAAEKSLDVAVLHLARRPGRLPAVRGAVAGGRARGARAPAARRPQHRRARPGHRHARRAPEHRGSPLQPGRAAREPGAQFRDRLHAREPAHAQQVVHRRQPGERRGRAQHRRRVLRRGQRHRLRRPGRDRAGVGGARGIEGVRPLLEQPVRVPGSELRRRARPGRRRRARGEVRGNARRPRVHGLPGGGAHDPADAPGVRRVSWRSTGRPRNWSTTTRRRRSTPPSGPTCCSCRSC